MDKPKIRFQGFEEAWCEKTLGEIAECNYGGGTPSTINKDYWSSCGLPWIQSSDLIQDDVLNVVPRKFITAKALKNTATKFIPSNSLAIVTRVGVGKLALIPFDYATSQDFTSLSKLKTDKYFSAFSIYTLLLKDLNLVQGTSIKGITKDEILQKDIFIPSLPEQEKIGKLFERIDHLLNLQQRKCDKLNDIKKSMLTKMFPKPGKRVPEVRFEGFTDDWVECKISDLFKITRGNVLAETKTNSKASKINPYPVYSSQTKKNGLLGYYSNYLYEDAITWTTDGANAGTVKFRPGKFYCTNVCGVLLTKTVEANPMIAEALNMVAKRHVSYVGNPKLMNNVMADISLKIPLSQKERTINSNFFHKLDTLIRLNELKLSKLRLLKRSFLKGMFV
ncbi:MAG: restriction endonuclease subunit S [Porphyromonadaceae bacterium]|nr:restriction endonuclease subunit S [Porphyromonadaceae bacterium]